MISITGGTFKGRKLKTPSSLKTRPTLSKVREAVFSSLFGSIEGANVLDLFSGSGAMGFEAISRGAAHCTFVESSKAAVVCLRQNAETLSLEDQIRIVQTPVHRSGLPKSLKSQEKYDLVFADPPYDEGWLEVLLNHVDWEEQLSNRGLWVLECRSGTIDSEEVPTELEIVRNKKYGDTEVVHFRLKGQ